MKEFADMKHFPMLEVVAKVMSHRTQNSDLSFFNINAAYHLLKLPSMMYTRVDAQGYGNHSVNFYALALANSGFGKGFSNRIIEGQVINRFKKRFIESTAPFIAERNIRDLANIRAAHKNTDPDEEFDAAMREYKSKGVAVDAFDTGSPEGVKQQREGILMGKIGSLNFEVDEIASKFINLKDLTDLYLELFDGKVKAKLIKNTNDQVRSAVIDGETPTNMLLFGEPSLLFDGSTTEEAFEKAWRTGYGRRTWLGYSQGTTTRLKMTPAERVAMLKDKSSDAELQKLSVYLEKLADDCNYGITVTIPEEVLLLLAEYELYCLDKEAEFKSNEVIRRAEARGRFFKTFRAAAGFTWLDGQNIMSIAHLEAAIKLAEESAEAFDRMMNQPPVYARLAHHLAEDGKPLTHAELMQDLAFYPKVASKQVDLIKNTIAWGHKNNIVIKRSIIDDIEFIQGEALRVTDLNELYLSHSTDYAEGYIPETKVPFSKLGLITQNPTKHWAAHRFVDGHRHASKAIQGFNLIVLDIDGGCTINEAQTVLEDYVYHIYSSKSHKVVSDKNPQGEERFRIVIPMSHHLKADPETYSEFMKNIHEFLPFPADTQTGEIARKWESCESTVCIFKDTGKLFDILPFIPKTKKNDERITQYKKIENSSGIQRWFLAKILEDGCRNNHLQRFGYMLMSGGYDVPTAQLQVQALNAMLPEPLAELELHKTVFSSMLTHATKKAG